MTFILVFFGGFILLPMFIIWIMGGYDEDKNKPKKKERDPTDWYDGGFGGLG